MLRVVYFASIRESLGKDGESIALPDPPTVAGLVDVLRAKGDAYSEALSANRRWRVALNQNLVGLDAPLAAGDEVAIFPPVTGG
jgi:sulfur-carrier protein